MVRTDGTNYHTMIFENLQVNTIQEDQINAIIDVHGEHGDEPRFLLVNDTTLTIKILENIVFAIEIDECAVRGIFVAIQLQLMIKSMR
jgi:hypothetical protein